MSVRFLLLAFMTFSLVETGFAQSTSDDIREHSAAEIIATIDSKRFPHQSFSSREVLTEFVRGKKKSTLSLLVYGKEGIESHHYNSVVRYLSPARDAGKMVLYRGTNLWFYDPASKASVRISPQQRLIGQASVGDVATVNLGVDYSAELVGAELMKDVARIERNCWRLELKAVNESAQYSRVEMWVDRKAALPIKGKFYADSGRLLKIAYYTKFRDQAGSYRPTQTIIIDAVNTNLVTTIDTVDYRETDIPDVWFQREFLPRIPEEW